MLAHTSKGDRWFTRQCIRSVLEQNKLQRAILKDERGVWLLQLGQPDQALGDPSAEELGALYATLRGQTGTPWVFAFQRERFAPNWFGRLAQQVRSSRESKQPDH